MMHENFFLLNKMRQKRNLFFFLFTFQMDLPKWELKTNYMLACAVSKYGLNPGRWDLVANELSDYIKITPQVGSHDGRNRMEGVF